MFNLLVVVGLLPPDIHSRQTRQVPTMSSTIWTTLGGTPAAVSIRFIAFLLAWNQ